MKKLSLLILCLLVLCKSFSQTDTLSTSEKPKYVFLTEEQARANIKELIAYDALKKVADFQDYRIENLSQQIKTYERVVARKDSIISYKDSIIDVQEKIIKAKWLPKIRGYAGAEFLQFDFSTPSFYGRTALEFKKWNVGVQFNARPVEQFNLPHFYGTFRAEFRIF